MQKISMNLIICSTKLRQLRDIKRITKIGIRKFGDSCNDVPDKCTQQPPIDRDQEILRRRQKCKKEKCEEDCRPFMPCPGLDDNIKKDECNPCDEDGRRKIVPERGTCRKPSWKK